MKNLTFYLILFLTFSLISNETYAQKIGVVGDNTYGQFGNGTTGGGSVTDSVTIVGSDSDWIDASCGDYHNLALKNNHTLWAWGRNHKGQLGDGTTTDKNVPTQIGSANNWAQMDAGEAFSMAIKTDGTLWGWGSNSNGQLGDGTSTDKQLPTQIGTGTDWAKIRCGAAYVLAIKTDSSLWAWGENSDYQLGDGTTTDKATPTLISNDNWIDIQTTPYDTYSFGLKSDSLIYRWGGSATTATPTGYGVITLKIPDKIFPNLIIKRDSTLGSLSEPDGMNMTSIPPQTTDCGCGEKSKTLITASSGEKVSVNEANGCSDDYWFNGRTCIRCSKIPRGEDGEVDYTFLDYTYIGTLTDAWYVSLLGNGEVWSSRL